MGFMSGVDYFALPISEKTWIVKNVLPVGGMLNIYGKPKTGKSMLALQLASAISSGKPEWMSFGIQTHSPVAYLQLDTPRSLWMERVKHLSGFGWDFANVFFTDSSDPDLPYPFDVLGEGGVWLEKDFPLIPGNPGVLIIDTIRECHAGSEDESAQMKNVIAAAQKAVPGIAIVWVSHSRKGGNQNFGGTPDLMDENRGSGYVAGRMDCVLWLREKSFSAKGRALAEMEVSVGMDPDSYAIVLEDRFVQDAIELVSNGAPRGISDRELAKELNSRHSKKSYEACRSMIRRVHPATV